MDTPLRILRLKLGITLAEIFLATKIDTGAMSKIERGMQGVSRARAAIISDFYRRKGHSISELKIMYPERYTKKAA